jgi:cbb3-type cytochrome oxidase subunit 3
MGTVNGILVGGTIFLVATIFFAIAAARRESAEEANERSTESD